MGNEFDGEDLFFGLVEGFCKELGYFSLSELQKARGPLGLPVERDLYWQPKRLEEMPSEISAWTQSGTMSGYGSDGLKRARRESEAMPITV